MLRQVFKLSTSISLLAPFAGNWIAMIFFMVYANSYGLFDTAGFWVGLILLISWTIFIMIIQVTLSPKIFRWADLEPGTDPDTDPIIEEEDDTADVVEINPVDDFLATF